MLVSSISFFLSSDARARTYTPRHMRDSVGILNIFRSDKNLKQIYYMEDAKMVDFTLQLCKKNCWYH